MKTLITFLLFIYCSFLGFSQYWGTNTTSAFTNEAIDIETDASGNQYVAGYITGETSFNTSVVQLSAAGNGDIYIAKYNAGGNLIWIKQFGGNFSDRPTDLCLGDGNSIYITGQYFGQVNFGGTILNSVNTSKDIFILKLDNLGNVLWAQSEGGSGNENAYGITTDNQYNLILTGQFEGASILQGQNYSSTIDPITGLPSYDMFIAKYNQTGLSMWHKTGIADYEDRGLAVSCDDQNNIFVTGQFSDTLVFAGSTFNNMGYNVGFLAKFAPSGQLLWFNQLRAGMVMPYDLEVNDLNEVVVSGDFLGNLNYYSSVGTSSITNTYSKKIFAMKTTTDGIFMWGKALGSNNEISARSISIDGAKNSYITGYFKCDLSELHDTSTAYYNSVGFKDAYLWKLDNLGNTIFVKQFGSKKNDEGHGVAIQPSNQPVICGSYTENLNIPIDPNLWNNYTFSSTNNFNLHYYQTISDFAFLFGDESRNSFITNAVQIITPNYNFFNGLPTDSLFGNINGGIDTIEFCLNETIGYLPYTSNYCGPDYTYQWNTGATTQYIGINQTGEYSVIVERADECSNGGDSIFGIFHALPPLPLLTDNLGLAINEPGSNYYNYTFCAPDSVEIWFNDLCPSCSIIINSSSTPSISDTIPHIYNVADYYSVTVQDSFCTNLGDFTIEFEYPFSFDTIQPYLYFEEDADDNDTITICINTDLHIDVYDFLTNVDTTLNVFNFQPAILEELNISPQVPYYHEFQYQYAYQPQTTGWYTFEYLITLGYHNLCGIDTHSVSTKDSIYIIVNPLPTASTTILGDNLLCPNGSAYLYVTNTIPGFNWYGPGIEWTSQNGDSIQVSSIGYHRYAGTLIDTITGCSDSLSFSHLLQLKQPPTIIMDPQDGIVCPNDSVNFWLPNTYISYDWIGPDGFNISITNTATDDDQGFYYCHVVDSSGCSLTTTPAEIKEFTTPTLFVEPSNVICPGESATITVTYLGNAVIQWTSPIISSADEITATQIGYYVCQINQCDITFLDSVEIIDGSFQISISTTDTLLCYNENAVISTNNGFNDYQWSNGMMGSSIISVTDQGYYSVSATNQFGCIALSDTLFVAQEVASIPPVIADLTICPGNSVTLSEYSNLNLNWYDTDTTLISFGPSLTINSIAEDTSFLASYLVPNCPAAFAQVTIQILDSLPVFEITGDSIHCPNELAEYHISTTSEVVSWYLNSTLISTGNLTQYTAPSFGPTTELMYAVISNQCYSDTLSFDISTVQPANIALSADSLLICNYSNVPLTANGLYDTLIWTNSIGMTFIADTFYLTSQDGNGQIYVQGIDTNGCLTNNDSIAITTSQLTYEFIQNIGNSCFNDSIEIGILTSADSIIWNTPLGSFVDTNNFNLSISNNSVGWYTVELWDTIGCIYVDSLNISANEIPLFTISNDTMLCLNDWLAFNNLSDSVYFTWEGIGVVDSIPVVGNSWYVLTATTQFGCTYTDSIFVEAINCENSLPNVMTPNGDGANDLFIIDDAYFFTNNSLLIINRWGNVVYKMEGYNNTFDGGELVDGVYFYTFTYDISNPESKQAKGFLHLIKGN